MNINSFKQYRNGIKILTTDQFYFENIYVVQQHKNELTLLSSEHENDVIRAMEDNNEPSFIYNNIKYKITQRIRFKDNTLIIDAGFDF